jgi:acetoin utilization protein AcuB
MTKDIVTVSTDLTIEEVAGVLLENDIFSAPVINREGEMSGIITHSDLARALISLAGGNKGGIFYGFMLEDRPGSIKEIADIIRDHGGRLASILTSIEGVPNGFRKVYIRVYGIDRFRVRKLNEMLKENSDVFKISEQLEVRREIQSSDTQPMIDTI